MNVIDYIKNIENCLLLFNKTFDTPISSFHLDNDKIEAKTFIYIMDKKNTESIEEALMISIIQEFVRFGDFYFEKESKTEILDKVITHLNHHFGSSKFELNSQITFENKIEGYKKWPLTRIYINGDWNSTISKSELFRQDWIHENSFKTFHLKSEWNDEDYLFETENYYIRYNWGTSA
ncbi:hypothetical protein GCM10011506_01610 [Marivirga lumbricoides]|uniref:Uncharacterized protein n=1 Tax=Marivirga lumbricoides TaxID=1046115 RepID=A0ABQ1L8W5_9BACT|nr:hypothetical protein GCM10011506_01610 [Marivirga lumbricoides]